MDNIFATIIAIPSLFYLAYDYNNRKRFGNLLENGSDRNFCLNSGSVVSTEPLPNNDFFGESVIGKEIIIKLRTYHTHYHNTPIYFDNDIVINIPIHDTTIDWITNSKYRKITDNITLSNNPDSILFLGPETKILWDKKNEIIDNNIKTTEKYMYNNISRMIFGNIIGKNINVKYIGSEKYVTNKVRSDHYGINNWLTGLTFITLTLSTGWIINNFKSNVRTK